VQHKGIHCPNYNKNPAYNECMYSAMVEGVVDTATATGGGAVAGGGGSVASIAREPSTELYRNTSDGRRRMYFMRTPDLDQLLAISTERFQDASSTETNALKFTEEEIEKLKGWLQEEDTDDNDAEDNSIILHTTKPCPRCRFPQSHFHGHKCHSVTCGRCRTSRCYKCNQTSCRCGGGYCKPLQGLADITDYLVLEPYPHDKRCGCAICFDCRPGKPCGTCEGADCAVCRGYIQHGPQEVGDPWEPMTPAQRTAAEEYDRHHPVPRLSPQNRLFFDAVAANDLKAVEDMLSSVETAPEARLNAAGVIMTQYPDGRYYCNQIGPGFGASHCSPASGQCQHCHIAGMQGRVAGGAGSGNALLRVSDPRDFNRTALHVAASLGFSDMVVQLISSGATLGANDEFRMTPFCIAVVERRIDVLRTLATHPKCIDITANLRTQQGGVMHAVCSNNLLDILKLMCESANSTMKDLYRAMNNEGLTPLQVSCRQPKSEEIILYLLKKYEDEYRPQIIQNEHFFDSLLSDCISHGNKKSAAKILEFYESGDSKLDISSRAFDEACKQGYQDLVRMMLKLGAVPTQHSVAAACLSKKDLAFVALLFEHERFDVGVPKECITGDGPIKYHGLNMAAACILGKRIDILIAILDKFPFLSRIETDNYQDDSDSFTGFSRKCGSLLNFACLHGRLDIAQ